MNVLDDREGGVDHQPRRDEAISVMWYLEGWLSGEWPDVARYIRQHMVEIADQMVDDECADHSDRLADERDRQTAATAVREFADRFRPGDSNPWALHVRARARQAADRIERGE